jgi:adenine-specific DNA-methyltransferase
MPSMTHRRMSARLDRLSRPLGQSALFDNEAMSAGPSSESQDSPALRKARGAFFTPRELARFIAGWAIRTDDDRVFEPSAGDAEFLVCAVDRLRELAGPPGWLPTVYGVEIHPESARDGRQRVRDCGGEPRIREKDIFLVHPEPLYQCVIGNPPFIRFQDFIGPARERAREAARRGGVALTGLASSWAAFTVHSALFLSRGGRLGLVLPAELLSVNYAAPVRSFLLDRFSSVELVLFDQRVFPEAEADVVLLLADGYGQGPADQVVIRRARDAADLASVSPGRAWAPRERSDKWTGGLVEPSAEESLKALLGDDRFSPLETWGDTTLGIVTGNNRYFTLTPQQVENLGLPPDELLPLSPAGSSHLRGLEFDDETLTRLGREGRATQLFHPGPQLSASAEKYIAAGREAGVAAAYKCRVRKVWYQVPIVAPADLLLTCMNADTPRLTTNAARAHHLNSVHGVYLREAVGEVGRELLPLASLNSVTLLHAEIVGRSYGGGILKMEPKEADRWAVPAPALVIECADALRPAKDKVADLLQQGRLLDAAQLVDQVFIDANKVAARDIESIRQARAELARRRTLRATRAR